MQQQRYFFGRRPYLFAVDAVEGWDVDTADDMRIACRLFEGEYVSCV